jgi:hypothetical protein
VRGTRRRNRHYCFGYTAVGEMRRRTPQEKKADSYALDRRNAYGESSKGSRRSVMRNKRARTRSARRSATTLLAAVQADASEKVVEVAEARLQRRRGGRWRKVPDVPLGQRIVERLDRRVRLGIDTEASAVAKIQAIRAKRRRATAKPKA